MTEPLHIISLGAGVQSSTMALMAAAGEITPMPHCAIFADTGDESKATYTWLDWLVDRLPFPVVRAYKRDAQGNAETLAGHVFRSIEQGTRVSKPPLYTSPLPGEKEGLLSRDCTGDFKVSVIQRAVRQQMAKAVAKSVVQWIGISVDEARRARHSKVQYSEHRFPLFEKFMNRHDCLIWMESNGFPVPPRSACVYCPHRSNSEWRRIRDEDAQGWKFAVEFDARIRTGIHGVRQKCFVHRSCVPLDLVDLSTDEERGQLGLGFDNECEGMCGV